jgi:phospholipase/carboxylesterase
MLRVRRDSPNPIATLRCYSPWHFQTMQQLAPREPRAISRREFGGQAGRLLVPCVAAAGCGAPGPSARSVAARLRARPSATRTTRPSGTHALGVRDSRDAVLYVPPDADGPLPLVVLLHGAGGSGGRFLHHLDAATHSLRAVILAPDSIGRTWDALRAEHQSLVDVITSRRRFVGFGPDVASLEAALEKVFQTVAIDSTRIAVAGFSDGATYALSLGLINGDLFQRIVAFSPGFIVDGEPQGKPEVFVSHGRDDEILPIDRCSRRIVSQLGERGYAITFRGFGGGHEVPEGIAREAMTWAVAER